jgi:hypothetical protein
MPDEDVSSNADAELIRKQGFVNQRANRKVSPFSFLSVLRGQDYANPRVQRFMLTRTRGNDSLSLNLILEVQG